MLQILQWLLSYKYCVKSESESISCSVVADSLWPHGLKAPLSMDFSGQKSWSGWSFPFPGNLPDPGIESRSPALQADSLPSEPLLLLRSHYSRVGLCETPETAAHQAPTSLGFSRQEHWSGLPFSSSELSLPIPIHFSSLISKMSMFILDHIQFILIYRPNIPGS